MDLYDVIEARFSVRSYARREVPPEALDRLVAAFSAAPTAANRQPLGLLLVKTAGREEELKRVYGRAWFTEAPLVAVVCTTPGSAWVRSDGKNYADVDAAIAFQTFILAATAEGLGTCWIGAFDPAAAREVFGLPEGVEPVAMTPLGYPSGTAQKPPRLRKPLAQIVHHDRW
jgi:nitroreductase